jgi:hypothetical protein
MVALDHGDRATGPEQPTENRQRFNRLREVLENEADENMVERLGREGQSEDVGLPELHVGESGGVGPPLGFGERVCGEINRHESSIWAAPGERDRLGADAASGFEHEAPARVCGVGVQQLDQRSGLILQALVLPRVITGHIRFAHDSVRKVCSIGSVRVAGAGGGSSRRRTDRRR